MNLFNNRSLEFTSQSYMDEVFDKQLLSTFRRSSQVTFPIICCVVLVIYIIINIIVTYNIRNDHLARTGKKLTPLQMIGLIIAGLIVLPFYLSKRTQGKLVFCLHCGKEKLQLVGSCYQCGKSDERLESKAIIMSGKKPHLMHAHTVKGDAGSSLTGKVEIRGEAPASGNGKPVSGKNGKDGKKGNENGALSAEEIQAQQQVRQEQEKQAAINTVAGMSDSTLLLTLGGAVMEANQAFKDMAGLNTMDLLGKNIRNILPPLVHQDQRTEVQNRLQDAISRGTGCSLSVNLVLPDQREIFGRLNLTHLMNSQAKTIAILLTVQDLSDIRKAEEEKCEQFKSVVAGTADIIASLSGFKDTFTADHQKNTAKIAYAIAETMGLPEDEARGIYMAGLLHDVGKIRIPAEILNKEGELTTEEYEIVKQHCRHGYEMLKEIKFPWPVAQIVLQHHERLNGTGYPQGLPNKDICREAKVLAAADVMEAMTHKRPYRDAHEKAAVIRELREHKEVLYDMKVVDACLKILEKNGKSH